MRKAVKPKLNGFIEPGVIKVPAVAYHVVHPPRLDECSGPSHAPQRSRAESCAMFRPIEMRGSQLIGLSLITRHRGQ